jgi:metal-responsive CopG/Arc/MetJ family transcriptional regulator
MRESRFRETIRVRLPAGLHSWLEEVARREERSHSEIIREALRTALEPRPAQQQERQP